MNIEFQAITAAELNALADFIRKLAEVYEGHPPKKIEIQYAISKLDKEKAQELEKAPKPESEPAPEKIAEPVEKKRRGRPPKAQTTEAEYAAAAGRATEYTAKRVTPEPEPVEEPAEVQAADVADEAAESAVVKTQDPKLTHDDVRQELGAYMRKYGMPAAQEDGPKLFKIIFPEATPAKISDIPGTQEDLGKVLAGIREMAAKNPYQRVPVST